MAEYVTVWRDHEPTMLHWGVPVVRCRDCKYCMSYWKADYCDYFSHAINGTDGFCAWGVRRANEHHGRV